MGEVFECEVQPRFRDLNVGDHLDSVEVIRVVDEARILFVMFTPLGPPDARRQGLLTGLPAGVTDLTAAQRVEYRGEMGFVPFRPLLVRIWVSHVGRTSFRLACELRVVPDGDPTALVETTVALRDRATGNGWPIGDEVRDLLERYRGEPLPFR